MTQPLSQVSIFSPVLCPGRLLPVPTASEKGEKPSAAWDMYGGWSGEYSRSLLSCRLQSGREGVSCVGSSQLRGWQQAEEAAVRQCRRKTPTIGGRWRADSCCFNACCQMDCCCVTEGADKCRLFLFANLVLDVGVSVSPCRCRRSCGPALPYTSSARSHEKSL